MDGEMIHDALLILLGVGMGLVGGLAVLVWMAVEGVRAAVAKGLSW
jgi:hypothetical protein